MNKIQGIKLAAVTLAAVLALTGCGSAAAATEAVDLNALSVDEITAKAKEEGVMKEPSCFRAPKAQ